MSLHASCQRIAPSSVDLMPGYFPSHRPPSTWDPGVWEEVATERGAMDQMFLVGKVGSGRVGGGGGVLAASDGWAGWAWAWLGACFLTQCFAFG